MVVRLLIIAVSLGAAVSVQNLSVILVINGCVFVFFLQYFLPCYLYVTAFKDDKKKSTKNMRILCYILMAQAVLGGILGLLQAFVLGPPAPNVAPVTSYAQMHSFNHPASPDS